MEAYYQSRRGQGMIEYALIIVLVSVMVIIVLSAFGTAVANVFSNIISHL